MLVKRIRKVSPVAHVLPSLESSLNKLLTWFCSPKSVVQRHDTKVGNKPQACKYMTYDPFPLESYRGSQWNSGELMSTPKYNSLVRGWKFIRRNAIGKEKSSTSEIVTTEVVTKTFFLLKQSNASLVSLSLAVSCVARTFHLVGISQR